MAEVKRLKRKESEGKMNNEYLSEMERLERLANELKLQRYTKLEGNSPLQADYINAIKETLNAYNRLTKKIGDSAD